MPEITTFFMFEGQAEEAMTFYMSVFPNSEIVAISRYGPNEQGPEGTIYHATFTLDGQRFMCIDSPINHNFTFTPSISLWVTCATAAEVDDLYAKLVEGGQVLMPLDAYPFSERFAWVADRFGVTWQLAVGQG